MAQAKVFNHETAVKVRGTAQDGGYIETRFCDLKKGDEVIGDDVRVRCVVGQDAHHSGDASYDGWLFYDANGESYFPEDFGAEQLFDKNTGGNNDGETD